MQNMLSGLAALHQLAAQRGDGLHPKLLDLAQRDQKVMQQGAVPLNTQQVSAGPVPNGAVASSDARDNVTVLHSFADDTLSKNTG